MELIATVAILGLMVAIGLRSARVITAPVVPMRWSFTGVPGRFSRRPIALAFPVLIGFASTAIIYFVMPDGEPLWPVPLVAFTSLAVQLFYLFLLLRWQKSL